jgi:hypothetical protein
MPDSQVPHGGPQRFVIGVFGFVFGGIGVTVICHLWTQDGFGAPPVFFKLFGSFIALAFVAMGGMFLVTALKTQPTQSSPPALEPSADTGAGYTCPACGARLGEDADVSPMGDVKCGYCRKWFNIHSS